MRKASKRAGKFSVGRMRPLVDRPSQRSAKLSSTRRREGSMLAIVIICMFTVTMLALTLISLSVSDRGASIANFNREQALAAADAGIDYCIWLLANTAPNGTTDGSWRTTAAVPYSGTMPGSGATFKVVIADGTGRFLGLVVFTSTGKMAKDSVTVQVVVNLVLENVSPWANAIYAGTGQGGNAITGNVTVHGSVHIDGNGEPYSDINGNGVWDPSIQEPYTDTNKNGQWDTGEPYTDLNNNHKWDSSVPEPFTDLNGNGTYDPPVSATALAAQFGGTAAIMNNYEGAPSSFSGKLPSLSQVNYNGQQVYSLGAKLRVQHGEISLFGNATIGQSSSTVSTGDKATIDGSYVNDGFTAGSAASVYSDNGTSHVYDLPPSKVKFPTLFDSVTSNGTTYANYIAYYSSSSNAYQYNGGDLHLDTSVLTNGQGTQGHPYTIGDSTNYVSCYATGVAHFYVTLHGIVHVTNGDIYIGDQQGAVLYTGTGTLVAKGTISTPSGTDDTQIVGGGTVYVHGTVLADGTYPSGGFPTNVLGLVAPGTLQIETGSGDSQSDIMGAFYAEDGATFGFQTNVGGSVVANYYTLVNVPDIFQVPSLASHLPPGMPGGTPIYIVHEYVKSYQQTLPP